MPRERHLPTTPTAHPAAVVAGDRYRITVLADGLVRLEYSETAHFEDRASTLAVNRAFDVPDFTVHDTGTHLEVVTARMRLTYDKGPFSTSGLSVAVQGGISSYHSVWRFGQPADDLGGTARTLDEADGAVPLEPGVVSRNGYAVIDDSTSLLLDDAGWVAPRPDGGHDLYVFAYGHDYAEALEAFYTLSGHPPVLPRFALGNWWSRYHRYTADSYAALIERFQDEGTPFSVSVIDMDWHLTDVPREHGSGWTGYTWNRELFPQPAEFLAWLHERGLRVTLNVHPADGVRAYEGAYPAMAEALGLDATAGEPIAFDVTDPEFLAAYFDVLHRGLEADGVDFWWVDWQSGPHSRVAGIDPLWMLNHFHFIDNARDDRRALTFSRYAGPGSHRYPVGFSGDSVISWASLAFQPHFTATASNIGYGWWSHDIGGHFHGTRDDELATRWLQLGVFSPITRLHSGAHPFITKEPWTFPADTRATMVELLRLRHRLVPYLHTMNHRAAAGTPLVLPMYYAAPEAPQAYDVPDQYAFGSELLVAAITQPCDPRTRTAPVRTWLPAGVWVDVLSDIVYDGDRELTMYRDTTTLPVLAGAGAIVPLDGHAVPGNDPVNPEHLEVLVVVGADGAFELVEDDGTTSGSPARTRITLDQAAGRVVVHAPTGPVAVLPERRTWTVTLPAAALGSDPVVTVDGRDVPGEVRRTATRVSVTVADVARDAEVVVDLGAAPALHDNHVVERVFALLDRAQIEYDLKKRVHDVVASPASPAARISQLLALHLEPALLGAVSEQMLAGVVDRVAPARSLPAG